jgi:hypothetical protein
MQKILYSIADFFAPKPVSRSMNIIEAVNECDEKIYIQIGRISRERRENIQTLLMKSKRLLSFIIEKREDDEMYYKIMTLIEKVEDSFDKNDDISHLFEELRNFENRCKKSSKSFTDLSTIL